MPEIGCPISLTGIVAAHQVLIHAGDFSSVGRPEEIAAAALFLAGPGATFMTGQCVSPNGGAAMF